MDNNKPKRLSTHKKAIRDLTTGFICEILDENNNLIQTYRAIVGGEYKTYYYTRIVGYRAFSFYISEDNMALVNV